jgi:hypothetical protein
MAGPSKCAHLLVDLPCAQEDAEEQYADIGSEEELGDTTLQDPSSVEENGEDLGWCCQFPSAKADVHQFVGEQNGLNKTTATDITENSQPFEFLLLYFQTILAVTVQETNQHMQQDAQARNKPDIPYSHQVSEMDLYVFFCSYSSDRS